MTAASPLTAAGPDLVVSGAVLVVVLVIGLVTGLGKRRFGLLLVGMVAVLLIGALYTRATGELDLQGSHDVVAAQVTRLYTVTIPPAIAFLAGWLLARGTWLRRLVVLAVAALLLASFPYAAVGAATADALLAGG